MQNKEEQALREISEICKNSLRDNNKMIHLEKILHWCNSHASAAKNVWSQNGIPLLLLQETIAPYKHLNKPTFTKEISHNVSTVLKILNILAKDNNIKKQVLESNFHYYMFSYITTYDSSPLYEEPRMCVLNVMYTLLSCQNASAYIKNTELVPIILKNIDLGSCEVKCLSIQVFYKIVATDEGLNFVTQTFDRFSAMNQVFSSITILGLKCKSYEIIKWLIQIYIRLCDKPHIKKALKMKGPDNLVNAEMNRIIVNNNECSELYKKFRLILENP